MGNEFPQDQVLWEIEIGPSRGMIYVSENRKVCFFFSFSLVVIQLSDIRPTCSVFIFVLLLPRYMLILWPPGLGVMIFMYFATRQTSHQGQAGLHRPLPRQFLIKMVLIHCDMVYQFTWSVSAILDALTNPKIFLIISFS